MTTSRSDVYAAIDSERDYQESRKAAAPGDPSYNGRVRTPEEYMVYMQDYLNEAMHKASREWGPAYRDGVVEIIRKVTALGVACMEDHGAPRRFCVPAPPAPAERYVLQWRADDIGKNGFLVRDGNPPTWGPLGQAGFFTKREAVAIRNTWGDGGKRSIVLIRVKP